MAIDPFSGSAAGDVDKLLGSAYKTVRTVADNLPAINALAGVLGVPTGSWDDINDTVIGAGFSSFIGMKNGIPGMYVADELATAGLAAQHPAICDHDFSGRYWRLVPMGGVIHFAQLDGDLTGAIDNTNKLKAAIRALGMAGGGRLEIGPGTCLMNPIQIIERNIHINLDPDTVLKRLGAPPIGEATTYLNRGLFVFIGFHDANFMLTGGMTDLNGEGPFGMGIAGRFSNYYTYGTIPGIVALTGPANSAICAVRSTGINVHKHKVRNSGESGMIFRNCGKIHCSDIDLENIAGYGIELSWPDNDGTGLVEYPELFDYTFDRITGRKIQDFGMGTYNGVMIGGGGYAGVRPMGRITMTNIDCEDSKGAIQLELPYAGTYLDTVVIRGVRDRRCSSAAIALINVRKWSITDWISEDCTDAATSLMCPSVLGTADANHHAEVCAVTISGAETQEGQASNFRVIDTRGRKSYIFTDGNMVAGSDILQSDDANFTAADVGLPVCVQDTGPNSSDALKPGKVVLMGRIKAFIDESHVQLSFKAVQTVVDKKFAFGGAIRRGIRLQGGGGDVNMSNFYVEAGVHSGGDNEPIAAAIYIEGTTGETILNGRVQAPETEGTTPNGVVYHLSADDPDNPPQTVFDYSGLRVGGFDNAYDAGIHTYRQWTRRPLAVTPNTALIVTPHANADTYGTEVFFDTGNTPIKAIDAFFINFSDAIAAELLTLRIRGYRMDGGNEEYFIQCNTPDQRREMEDHGLWTLFNAGVPLKKLGLSVMSSKAGSTATQNKAFAILNLMNAN